MAAPGPGTIRFGGNTSCVEIQIGGELIICDAGTGIRPLGESLVRRMKGRPIEATILLSHLHWDHYIGLPFFRPLYNGKNRFVVAGPRVAEMDFGPALSCAMRPPYFPVPLAVLPSRLRFKTVSARPFKMGTVRIVPIELNHPGGAMGWRFYFPNRRSVVHVTDNEPSSQNKMKRLVKWMQGTDVLIHDAQYTPSTYLQRMGWGHSPFTYPITLAAEAGIPRVVFFHFDPADNDKRLSDIQRQARAWAREQGINIKCDLAREGASIVL